MTLMIRQALGLVNVLQHQAGEGYSEVIVQDPETLQKRLLVIDLLTPITRADAAEPPEA